MSFFTVGGLYRIGGCAMLLLLAVARVYGQYLTPEEKNRLLEFGTRYSSCFIDLDMEDAGVPTGRFTALFADDVLLVNDFSYMDSLLLSPADYFNNLKKVIFKNPYVKFDKINISTYDKFLYAKRGDTYYLWIYKQLVYRFGSRWPSRNFAFWQLLRIRDRNGTGLRIYSIEQVARPIDANHNRTPDNFEQPAPDEFAVENKQNAAPVTVPQTPNTSRPVGAAEQTAVDATTPQEPTVQQNRFPGYGEIYGRSASNGVAIDYFRPSHKPYYRFGFEVHGGAMLSQHWDMQVQPALMGGLALHWYVAGFLSLSAGYDYLNFPLNTDRISQEVKTSLRASNSPYTGVSVNSDAYQFHLVYGTLGLGTYRHYRWIFSAEGLYGEIYQQPLLNNNLSLMLTQPGGEDGESSQLSLHVRPFPVYGGRAQVALGLGESGRSRLTLAASYLRGKSSQPGQTLAYNHGDGLLALPPVTIQAWGVTLGVQVDIHKCGRF